MKTWLKGLLFIVAICVLLGALARFFLPPMLEKSMNQVDAKTTVLVSDTAQALHNSLVVGDWHSDSILWDRDLSEQANYGHVDLPRLLSGNVAMQMFTTVTKSPSGQNYDSNETDASDNITKLILAQGWPIRTWGSLTERALYQADRLKNAIKKAPEQMRLVRTAADLNAVMSERKAGRAVVASLLGTEGSHALDGELANIDRLYQAGFRMMSLHHFFDNKLGGSLHGTSGEGLTAFGRDVLKEIEKKQIILDVSHSSEAVVRDVLSLASRPFVVSHTGFNGHCDSPRNISDKLMKAIAAKGGLIAVGYWDGAVCKVTPENIVAAIRYGIDLVGVDHISLGSDYDGSTTVPFDTSGLAILTELMMQARFTEQEIRAVMGENMLAFLQEQLPKE